MSTATRTTRNFDAVAGLPTREKRFEVAYQLLGAFIIGTVYEFASLACANAKGSATATQAEIKPRQ